MASDNGSFFSDPKTMFALFAVVLSVGNLIWSLANQHEQNRRWNKINAGSMELSKVCFQAFQEITRKEMNSTNWGYVVRVYGAPDSIDKVQVIHQLRVRNAKDGSIVPNIDPTFTVDENRDELVRKNYKEQVRITKIYRPLFYLKNEGKTEVQEFVISAEANLGDGTWRVVAPPSLPQRVPANREINIGCEIELPLDTAMPDRIPFKLRVSYVDVNGSKTQREIPITWTEALNYWIFE